MKINAVLFYMLLLLTQKSFSQPQKLYISIEEAISVSPDSVYRLDLSKQKLEIIPKEIYNFKNLKELYLSKNKLSKLDKEFLVFQNLEVLDLSKNKFTNFPSQICSLGALKQLFLGRNNIAIIPDCIGQLSNLEVLDLWYNPLDGLPNSISQLKKMKSIDLRGVNFSLKTQEVIKALIPWVNIEFDRGCDCAN